MLNVCRMSHLVRFTGIICGERTKKTYAVYLRQVHNNNGGKIAFVNFVLCRHKLSLNVRYSLLLVSDFPINATIHHWNANKHIVNR